MNRLFAIVKTRLRAWRLGITLTTSDRFRLPKSIRLNGKRHALTLPNESGIRVAVMEVLIGDTYRLRQTPGPVNTVLDVGANVGVFCLAAREAFQNATIHAYEPNPALEKYLKVQAQVAGAEYFMKAVAREDGHVTLDVSSDSVCTTSAVDSSGSIPAVAFRRAIGELGGSVDLVKMDCEGAEWDILEDVDAWSKVRTVAMEYHQTAAHGPGTMHSDIRRCMNRLNLNITSQVEAATFGVLSASR